MFHFLSQCWFFRNKKTLKESIRDTYLTRTLPKTREERGKQTNTLDSIMTIKINLGPQPKEEDDGVDCKCSRDSWPLILLLTGFGVAFCVCLVSVLSLMTFDGVPGVVLSVYLIVLALIGLEAELRRFKFIRSLIYTFVIKYFYFLTNYYVRGFYYIFLGSILLGDAPLNIICGCLCMGFGVLLMGVHFFVGLPNYTDWQEVQAEAEARVRKEASNAAQAAAGLRSGNTPGAHEHTQPSGAVAPPPAANPSYQPAYAPPLQDTTNQNPYTQAPREPEVPSARRMATGNDDDLAREYYAQQQQQQQQQQQAYSPRDDSTSNAYQQPQPQVYGSQSAPSSRRNMAADNPFDAADEYQPPRF